MSKAELVLPGEYSPDEGNALVDRFTLASRELVPSVQITLAKRIIKPGTNRVVCLAARTSVPLNDDEVASVSDLALRLSDGTNVALSLSFFNENCASEYATFTHSIYDPHRYPEQTDFKLGMVVIATALAATAAFFSMASGPLNTFVNLKAGLAAITTPLIKSPANQAASTTGALPLKPAVTPKAAPKPAARKAKAVFRSRPKQSGAKTARSARASRDPMFVPPPPPFPYTLPNGQDLSPYEPFPTTWPPVARPKPMAQGKPASQGKPTTQSKPAALWNSQSTRLQPDREPAVAATAPATQPNVEREPVKASAPAHRSIWERPVQQAPQEQQSVPAVDDAPRLRAPVPGDDGTAPVPTRSPERAAAPVHNAPTPKFEPIPWPE